MGEWFAASLSKYTLSSQYSLPDIKRDFNYLSTFKQSELSTCSSELSANGSPLKPVRDSKTESLVNVQKIIKETNDQIATKPALVISGC